MLREKFRITDLGEDEYLEQDSDNYEDYEINYNSGRKVENSVFPKFENL